MSMKTLLKDLEIPAKHPSEEAQKNWRNLVTLVRNKRRRFRYSPNLEKRKEAKEQMEKLREEVAFPQSVWPRQICHLEHHLIVVVVMGLRASCYYVRKVHKETLLF